MRNSWHSAAIHRWSAVKVPQILKILQNKSAKGLSIWSILLDLFAITSSVAYQFNMGFPFRRPYRQLLNGVADVGVAFVGGPRDPLPGDLLAKL
uniref:Uncharacterized protein n=1 Tax=Timema douglasi TaxID=61478 RepID=A0A7R8V978_TIMDO|nr:unnamed protein product [Timema douglasi]